MATFKLFNNHLKIPFILLATCEGVFFFWSVYIATAIRFNTLDLFSSEIASTVGDIRFKAIVFALIHLISMTALGQYQAQQYRGSHAFLQMVSRVFVSMLLVSIALIVIFYVFPATSLGRGITGLAFFISLASIISLRLLFFHSIDDHMFMAKVLVFGVGRNAAKLIVDNTDDNSPRNYLIKGFISTPKQTRVVPEHRILALEDSLLEQCRHLDVNEIVIALDDRRQNYPTQQLLDCKLAGITIIDPVTFLEREQGKVMLALMQPSWMIYSEGFTVSQIKSFSSRLFDILASLSILIITAPALLLTAFCIALESGFKGPIFYRQQRIGKDGHEFKLYKFRSMQVNAEKSGAQWATEKDVRVTTVGRFIRKIRIDELPQILNILVGDMRLVGPRPERPEFVNKLNKKIEMYKQRHTVKPGLAGWAQLKYPYGATDEDAYEKLQYDLYYIKNANLVMDFFILLLTLEVIIFGKGVR